LTNKINKEKRRPITATPTRPSHKNQRQGAQADPSKNRTGHKAEHGHANHQNEKQFVTDKEFKENDKKKKKKK
jgi:hypothetical protein